MKIDFKKEMILKTSRSGGKGGQNVNKVETQVEARFSVPQSLLLEADEKEILLQKLSSKLTKENELIVYCNQARTQLENKELAIEKMNILLNKSLMVAIPRKKTKKSKASNEKRIFYKKIRSQIKENRSSIQIVKLSE